MFHVYLDFMERANDSDVALARAHARRVNLSARLKDRAFSMSERKFIKRYRLSKGLTRELITELTPHMPPTLRSALDVETKVLIALEFFATGSYQTVVGDNRKHCVAQASVSKAVRQVIEAINNPVVINKHIAFPFNQNDREQIKRKFYNIFRIPGVLGCIDGTHVAIVCPVDHEERFFNRKGYHSLNVLIVLIALEFFATGSYQTVVGDNRKHCVAQASVSKAVRQVIEAINNPVVINKHIAFPFNQNDREQIKRKFYNIFRIPGVLGCIDGTHVAIVCPVDHEERFFNRKGYHSLNVLIICDANMNILCVDPSYPGATHDSVIWANHPLNRYVERLHTISGENVFLLGDSGYPLRPTMLIPLSDPAPGAEEHYQDLHLTARSVVERCIGVLKARFRCLLVDRKLHYSPLVAARLTNACCVLHNIAHKARVPFTPLTAEEAARERRLTEGAAAAPAPPARRGVAALTELELGRARRQALIRHLWASRV